MLAYEKSISLRDKYITIIMYFYFVSNAIYSLIDQNDKNRYLNLIFKYNNTILFLIIDFTIILIIQLLFRIGKIFIKM